MHLPLCSQNGLCVASTTSVTTTPVVVPVGGVPVYPARPVYPVRPVTPVRRPVGGVATTTTTAGVVVTNPPGPRDRTAVAGKTTTTRAAGFDGSRGLKQVATGADTAGRHLLQGCAGGCASWINQSGGRRRCGACCAGYAMRVGDIPSCCALACGGLLCSTHSRVPGCSILSLCSCLCLHVRRC